MCWEGDFQQRKGAGTSTKLTVPEFDLPVFARQHFTQVQPPTPSVPNARGISKLSSVSGFSNDQYGSKPFPLKGAPTQSLCSVQTPPSMKSVQT